MNDPKFLNLSSAADRDYAIMIVRELRCFVIGIDDVSIYDAASVKLLPQEIARCHYPDRDLRVWRHGETASVDDIADRVFKDRVYDYEIDSIVVDFDRCERLHAKYCASDYHGSFFQFVYADMIESVETDHGRMVRAVNHINMRIGKRPIKHVMSTADLGSFP